MERGVFIRCNRKVANECSRTVGIDLLYLTNDPWHGKETTPGTGTQCVSLTEQSILTIARVVGSSAPFLHTLLMNCNYICLLVIRNSMTKMHLK